MTSYQHFLIVTTFFIVIIVWRVVSAINKTRSDIEKVTTGKAQKKEGN